MSRETFRTKLFDRIHGEFLKIKMIDTHEHLQRESEFPDKKKELNFGRLFLHYAKCDLISAGMPVKDMVKVLENYSLEPKERWQLMAPWYVRAWNTAYCECLRIAIQDIYGVEDFSSSTVEILNNAIQKNVKSGFTRKVFDLAGIDYAMTNPFGPKLIFNHDFDPNCFICDMVDSFTGFPILQLQEENNNPILSLQDYLNLIDKYFDRFGHVAGAFKVGRAYDRVLSWEDVPRHEIEKAFNRLLAFNDRPDRKEMKKLEDYILHYLCRKCGEYGIRMKFHTGLQEGNGNIITNSRAALMANLFMKYPKTKFDMYHISYPYENELAVLSKNFANVTLNFCWMWIINPAAGRRALGEMLDTVPANKIHGFGGDFIFVEGSYGHARIARREIARVLCEKVEEGRFSEDYALVVGEMLLRSNPIENFDLKNRRERFKRLR